VADVAVHCRGVFKFCLVPLIGRAKSMVEVRIIRQGACMHVSGYIPQPRAGRLVPATSFALSAAGFSLDIRVIESVYSAILVAARAARATHQCCMQQDAAS
jgi:hypothetical protein